MPSASASRHTAARSVVAALVLLIAMLAISGCPYSERDPVPIFPVVITVEGIRVNGDAMGERQAQLELKHLADRYREPDGSVRAIIRLSAVTGADYDRVRALQDYCVSIGLVRIEQDH